MSTLQYFLKSDNYDPGFKYYMIAVITDQKYSPVAQGYVIPSNSGFKLQPVSQQPPPDESIVQFILKKTASGPAYNQTINMYGGDSLLVQTKNGFWSFDPKTGIISFDNVGSVLTLGTLHVKENQSTLLLDDAENFVLTATSYDPTTMTSQFAFMDINNPNPPIYNLNLQFQKAPSGCPYTRCASGEVCQNRDILPNVCVPATGMSSDATKKIPMWVWIVGIVGLVGVGMIIKSLGKKKAPNIDNEYDF
jgi:hypothetical protein